MSKDLTNNKNIDPLYQELILATNGDESMDRVTRIMCEIRQRDAYGYQQVVHKLFDIILNTPAHDVDTLAKLSNVLSRMGETLNKEKAAIQDLTGVSGRLKARAIREISGTVGVGMKRLHAIDLDVDPNDAELVEEDE